MLHIIHGCIYIYIHIYMLHIMCHVICTVCIISNLHGSSNGSLLPNWTDECAERSHTRSAGTARRSTLRKYTGCGPVQCAGTPRVLKAFREAR